MTDTPKKYSLEELLRDDDLKDFSYIRKVATEIKNTKNSSRFTTLKNIVELIELQNTLLKKIEIRLDRIEEKKTLSSFKEKTESCRLASADSAMEMRK